MNVDRRVLVLALGMFALGTADAKPLTIAA